MNEKQAERLIAELHGLNKTLKSIESSRYSKGDAVFNKTVFNPDININVKENTQERATKMAHELVRKMFKELKEEYGD